jgi:hypothetical protein
VVVGTAFFVSWRVFAGGGDTVENCSEVRLDRSAKALKWIPSWQQKNTLICWAAAAAQLIDAERFRTGQTVERPTMPLNLASQTYLHSERRPGASAYLTGWPIDALKVAKDEGICAPTGFYGGIGSFSAEQVFEKFRELARYDFWAKAKSDLRPTAPGAARKQPAGPAVGKIVHL